MSSSSKDSPLDHAEAIDAIKKLQHRLGYLLEAGDWDGAAALFTDDATLQVGHHAPVNGLTALRALLPEAYDLDLHQPAGSARQPNPTGQLQQVRAHLQIMPVITIFPGADTAQATWRHLGTGGGPGKSAFWAEGPQEVNYRWEHGQWRIAQLHWFRTLVVPYDKGWQSHIDQTKPTSGSTGFASWPEVQRTDFHFLHTQPVYRCIDATAMKTSAPTSETEAADLAQRLLRLETTREVENLQGMLGYYLDKSQWTQAAALFTPEAQLRDDTQTLARGTTEILEQLRSISPEGPTEGLLLDLIHMQPDITVDVDQGRAHGRWKVLSQLAQSGYAHEWGLGDLQVDYVHTDQGWRIEQLTITNLAFTDYDLGWGQDRQSSSRILPQLNVGGEHEQSLPHLPSTAAPIPSASRTPKDRLTRVMAAQEVERLQYAYGYYLAEFLWDELVELFIEQGTLEIALRGVYRGPASIRRSLDLYGSAPENGVLHNHMQFQPVIHLDDSGTTAFIRARAFSMMGQFEQSSMWMGGIYENQLVNHNGEWRMRLDRVVNTYFAPYKTGWKELPLRSAPRVSTTIPPDEPPTGSFDMYPGANLVPYHYSDPQPPG